MEITKLFDLNNKVAIVTGGATHLGFEMASTLGELGANIIIASRRRDLCVERANELKTKGINSHGIGCDVTDQIQVDSLINETVSKFGRLDIMVCNAGGAVKPATFIPHGDIEEFAATMELNVNGTYLSANSAAKIMVEQRSGSIITVGSIHGSLTNDKRFYDGTGFHRGGASYQTAKAGIINFTRYLAMELGEYGVNANCISPGMIPKPDADVNMVDKCVNSTALRRRGLPSDLKGVVALLASDAGSWITGQNFIVDGGFTIW